MTLALIMAGGQSSRMRASGGACHKGLITVLGVPLVERNVCTLLAAGFGEVVVVVAAAEAELRQFVETRCEALARARNSSLRCWVESSPLGTIGAARRFLDEASEVVVVNVDNLTTLDLGEMLAHHRRVGASMTIAVHWEPFFIPYGEVTLVDGWVRDLAEKPVKRFRMSSGAYVLSSDAAVAFPETGPIGSDELFKRLMGTGRRIAGFEHDGQWIDINNIDAITRAEAQILAVGEDPLSSRSAANTTVTALLVHTPGAVLLEQRKRGAPRYAGLWDLPGFFAGDEDESQPERRLAQQVLLHDDAVPRFLLSFDDLDVESGKFIRYRVFDIRCDVGTTVGPGKWVAMTGDSRSEVLSSPAKRAVAALEARSSSE